MAGRGGEPMFGPGGPSFGELVYEGLLSTVAGYDHLAPKFDTTPFRTPDKLLDLVAAHLERGPRIEALLDLCCGTGAVLKRFEPLYDRALGVDFSPGMLEVARQGLAEDKVQLVHADITSWT